MTTNNNETDPLEQLLSPEIKSEGVIGSKGRKKIDIVWNAPTAEKFTMKDLLAANPEIKNTAVLISRFREQIGTLFQQVGQVAKPVGTKGRREGLFSKIVVA